LEVLLALGLSVLLLAAIAMAVDFHLRLIGTGRAEVEQAQLARAILARIADDLRNSIQYTPSNSTSSSSSTGTSSSSGSSTGGTSDGAETDTGGIDDSTSTMEQLDRTSNLANATSLPTLPGIYGNQSELQIDVSRLPRLDQMQNLLAAESTDGTPAKIGDLRTVTYFASGSAGPLMSTTTGLVRREIDRITASLALQQGDSFQTQGREEPMATEVEEIQFRYFDGTDWLDTWDTTERSGLPMAVQIGLRLARPGQSSPTPDESDPEATRTYQLTVHLPAARPTTASSTTTTNTTPQD
jgi:hypothetical protein